MAEAFGLQQCWDPLGSNGFPVRMHARFQFIHHSDRFVYLFANPYDVLLSFDRRGWIHCRAEESSAVSQLQGDMSYDPTVNNLEDYISAGKDRFRFGHHFSSFHSRPGRGLFVKYEALGQAFGTIKDFTGWEGTPGILRTRNSDYTSTDSALVAGMERIHGRWFDFYRTLPAIFYNDSVEDFYPHLLDSP